MYAHTCVRDTLTHTHKYTEPLSAHSVTHPSAALPTQELLLTLLACSPTSPGVPATYHEGALPRAWFDAATPLRLAALRALCCGPPAVVVQVWVGLCSLAACCAYVQRKMV
jgi:hypothetical protein